MKDKKHIDRLFQEKFKDFEAAPSNQVWKNIETELSPRKKKRAAFFWWRLGGLAAILIIAFLAGNWFYNTQNQPFKTSPSQVEISEPKLRDESKESLLTSEEKELEFNNTKTHFDNKKNTSEEQINKNEKRISQQEPETAAFKQGKNPPKTIYSAAQPKSNEQIDNQGENQRQLKVSSKNEVNKNTFASTNSTVNDLQTKNNNTFTKQ